MEIKTKDETYAITVNEDNPYELIITCTKKLLIIIKPVCSNCIGVTSEDY